MKKSGRQSTNVIDLRGPHGNVVKNVEEQRARMDKTKMFNTTPMSKQKPDVLEALINSYSFAGNNNPRGRISDLGVPPQVLRKK